MKKFSLLPVILAWVLLMFGACGEEPGSKPGQKAQPGQESQRDLGGAMETVSRHSLIKEPTRLNPGWVCPSHPNMKSYYPGTCPTCKSPLAREGEWTCPNHPHFSATAAGNCPTCNEKLVKVQEVEKSAGKPIHELTKEALAKAENK